MSQHLFIEPADVLILRANQLFGDAGSYGQTQVLPWPSVMAGALRSALLAHDGWDLQAFASGERPHPAIGTPQPLLRPSSHGHRRRPDAHTGTHRRHGPGSNRPSYPRHAARHSARLAAYPWPPLGGLRGRPNRAVSRADREPHTRYGPS